ncbi:MAG TPA: hypothetical protein EYQ63_00355 [Fuerstia sp.]|nr:hypothetical protein [Fuerstiella sp.]
MRSVRFTAVWAAFCLLPVLFLGCGGGGGKDLGPTGEVEGTVTLDGEPLAEGSVALYDQNSGNTGGGELGPGGKFKFTVPVPVGTYQVSFQPPDAPPPEDADADELANANATIPEGYQSGETSEIVADVKEGPNTFTFELMKAGPKG